MSRDGSNRSSPTGGRSGDNASQVVPTSQQAPSASESGEEAPPAVAAPSLGIEQFFTHFSMDGEPSGFRPASSGSEGSGKSVENPALRRRLLERAERRALKDARDEISKIYAEIDKIEERRRMRIANEGDEKLLQALKEKLAIRKKFGRKMPAIDGITGQDPESAPSARYNYHEELSSQNTSITVNSSNPSVSAPPASSNPSVSSVFSASGSRANSARSGSYAEVLSGVSTPRSGSHDSIVSYATEEEEELANVFAEEGREAPSLLSRDEDDATPFPVSLASMTIVTPQGSRPSSTHPQVGWDVGGQEIALPTIPEEEAEPVTSPQEASPSAAPRPQASAPSLPRSGSKETVL